MVRLQQDFKLKGTNQGRRKRNRGIERNLKEKRTATMEVGRKRGRGDLGGSEEELGYRLNKEGEGFFFFLVKAAETRERKRANQWERKMLIAGNSTFIAVCPLVA